MFRLGYISLVSILLSGCVAVWGQSYNIDIKNEDYVQVNYDSSVINMGAMLADIKIHCAKYDKNYKHESTIRNAWGINMAVYNCVDKAD